MENLRAGLQITYKIQCQTKRIPLKLNISTENENPNYELYLSETTEHPHKYNHDKYFFVNSNKVSLAYKGLNKIKEYFGGKYIYITLKSLYDIRFDIICSFGNRTHGKIKNEGTTMRYYMTKTDLDEKIKTIVSNQDLLKECRQQAVAIIRKRKSIYTKYINSNKSKEINLRKSSSKEELNIKRKLVLEKNYEYEKNMKLKMFIHSHRWHILKLHDKILKNIMHEINIQKSHLISLIVIIKGIDILKYLRNKLNEMIMRIQNNEKSVYCGAYIYINFSLCIKQLAISFKLSSGIRISRYNTASACVRDVMSDVVQSVSEMEVGIRLLTVYFQLSLCLTGG